MDWDAVRNVNDNGLVQTARYLTLLEYLPIPMCTMPIEYGLQERVTTNLGLNILGALPVIGKAKTIFRMAKLNRVGKPTVEKSNGWSSVNNLKHKKVTRAQ
jgi:hypothetical protein